MNMNLLKAEREAFEKTLQNYKVPKRVKRLILKRTMLSRQLRQAITDIDEYCESIGLNFNHPLYEEAVLATDIRIFCEEDAGCVSTITAIEAVLAESKMKGGT